MVQPLWKPVWRSPIEGNMRPPRDPAVVLLGIYSNELKSYAHTKNCTWMFIAAFPTIAKTRKQPCPSVGEWINKQWSIQAMQLLSAENK